MDSMNNILYLNRVDRITERLKAVCLGQNTDFSDVLPPPLRGESVECRAAYLAHQLLFSLVLACDDASPEQYDRCRVWLYDTILFLLRDCREEDRNFYELGKLLRLPSGMRPLLFAEKHPASATCSSLCADEQMPWPLQNYDLAVLILLESLKLSKEMKPFFQKLETLLSEAGFPF